MVFKLFCLFLYEFVIIFEFLLVLFLFRFDSICKVIIFNVIGFLLIMNKKFFFVILKVLDY